MRFPSRQASPLYSPPAGQGISSTGGTNGCGLGVSGDTLYWLSGIVTSGPNIGNYQLMSLTPK